MRRGAKSTVHSPKDDMEKGDDTPRAHTTSRALPIPSAYGQPTTWLSKLQAPGCTHIPSQASQASLAPPCAPACMYPAPPTTALTYVHKEAAREDAELKVFTEGRRS